MSLQEQASFSAADCEEDFLEDLISSQIAVSFSGSNIWRQESSLGLSGKSSIELRTGGSRFQLSQNSSLFNSSRLSNGRGERTLNELLDCSCKVVEVLSASPQHLVLADSLADKLTAVTDVLARKVSEDHIPGIFKWHVKACIFCILDRWHRICRVSTFFTYGMLI